MEDTTISCIVVSALIITIMFVVTITIPDGSNSNTIIIFFCVLISITVYLKKKIQACKYS